MAYKKLIQIAKEEMAFYGVEFAPLQHLLAILASTNDSRLTGELSALGVRELSKMTEEDLLQFEGLGKTAASRIVAAFGIADHLHKSKNLDTSAIRSPHDASKCFEHIRFKDQEHFVCVYLNTKNMVLSTKTIFVGSLNAAIVHPREVFKEALRLSAASVIVGHNHPSGDPSPSREDIDVTKRLKEAGKIMGIELTDHIIMGDGNYVSLKEKGYV